MYRDVDDDVRSLIELYDDNSIESDSEDDSDNSESFSDQVVVFTVIEHSDCK